MANRGTLADQAGKLIASQLSAVGLVAGLLWHEGHGSWAKGLAYGGVLAALLVARLSATLQAAGNQGKERGTAIIYGGAVERFILVIAAIIFAATYLEFNIGAVAVGLIIAHLVHFVVAARLHWPGRKWKDSGIGE